VTVRRQAEQAVRENEARLREADRRKTEFLAALSHELRTPLTPIRNGLVLLERAPPGSPAAARAREVLQRQTAHLVRLVDDLLDVTRISHGKVELHRARIDLRELARRGCEDHRALLEGARIALRLELPDAPVLVDGDPDRLCQVIGNLLQNAAKFTPEGGDVRVAVEAGPAGAALSVRDSGIGIAAADLPRLFEPFVQATQGLARTQGGLGLGLALARSLAELHGGAVQARSDGPGRGAEFVVTLPLAGPAAPAEPARATAATAAARSILLIEDNPDAARTLADVLELQGHQVRLAPDGRSGLALARAARPDLVLCDIGLPDLDGYAVARALRADEALAGTRLVALSGYAQPEDLARARAAGFDDHVAKPPDPDALLGLVAGLDAAPR
jgi:CheY-like chemotaxis protein